MAAGRRSVSGPQTHRPKQAAGKSAASLRSSTEIDALTRDKFVGPEMSIYP